MNDLETDATPSKMSIMQFRKQLITLDDHLSSSDLKGMKFLCSDNVSISALENVHRGLDLFQELEKKGKLGPDSKGVLIELLYRIGRHDLMKKLGYSASAFRKSPVKYLSQYRVILFEICEEICKKDLEQMKFMCSHSFSKTKMESLKYAETFLIALEQTGQLSDDNLQFLHELLDAIDRADLAAKVRKFIKKSQSLKLKSKEYGPSNPGLEQAFNKEYPYGSRTPIHLTGPVPDKCSVPPISNMEEWNRRVQEMYIQEQTQKKLQDTEEAEMSSPRSPQEHDTTRCFVKPPVNSSYPPQMNDPSIIDTTRATGLSKPITSAASSMGQVSISRRVEPSAVTVSQGIPRNRPTQQVLTALVLTDAPRTQMSPSPQVAVQNTEAYLCSQPQGSQFHPLVTSRADVAPTRGVPRNLKEDTQIRLEDLPAYKMDSKPRGICLILNNQNFIKIKDDPESKQLPDRTGSEYDCIKLEDVFTKLGFVIKIVNNLKRDEMIGQMDKVAQMDEHKGYDCFMCCVMSHGALGSVYASDGREVQIRELTNPFRSVICSGLRGKPKIFFIQACQGKQKQPGARLHDDVEPDGPTSLPDFNPAETIPNEADFLLGYATIPGYVSFRSRTQGTWYITKLYEMLMKYADRFDLLSILIQVNEEVSRGNAPMEDDSYKQSPAPFATLRKKIYFR